MHNKSIRRRLKRCSVAANFLGNCFSNSSFRAPELRLLCSYGGQVTAVDSSTPKYSGGENRVVTVDRRWSASELLNHLSATLFGGQSFILKYHLPVSGARSLVSVVTDEDLQHMIEEHDRLDSSAKPRCLRAFLFSKDQEECVNSLVHRNDNLRLMCRYDGRFYFHPRREIQSYIGGHARIIVMDRPSSLSNLYSQISVKLFNGCKMTSFTLKYKRPGEGLFISLATDQDFQIMMELYNHLSSLPPKKYDHYDLVSPPKQFHLHLFVLDAETRVALPLQDDSSPPSLPINSTSSEDRPSNQPGEESIDLMCNKNRDSNPSEEPALRGCPIDAVPDPNCQIGIQHGENSGHLSSSMQELVGLRITRPPQQQLDHHRSIASANSGLSSNKESQTNLGEVTRISSGLSTIFRKRPQKLTKYSLKQSGYERYERCSVPEEDSDSSSTDVTD